MTQHIHESDIKEAFPPEAICERDDLAKAAAAINHVVETRNSVPMLANVRVLGGSGKLYFTGTDLNMELTADIPAESDARFGTTVPARLLKDLASKAPKGSTAVFTGAIADAGFTELKLGVITHKLQSLPVDDFPTLDRGELENPAEFVMFGADAFDMLESVAFAMSQEETRYFLNGVYLHEQGGTLACVATDGHRLGRWRDASPGGAQALPANGVIIPRKTVNVLLKLWRGKSCPDAVSFRISDTKITVAWPGYVMRSKLIDGTFPDYHKVIPTQNDKRMTVDSMALIDAVSAVSAALNDRRRAVKISLEGERAIFSVNDPDAGSASMELPVKYDGDEGMETGFNARYLIDMAKAACPGKDGGELVIALNSAGGPAAVSGTRERADYVQMPMRI